MKRRAFVALTLIVLFSILASALGCRGGGQATPGVTDTEIKIGVPSVFTGGLALDGELTKKTVDLYIEQTNSAGGINGRKLKAVYEDDGCDVTKGLSAVKKLIDQDQVFALAGISCTHVAVAAMEVVQEEKVPLLLGVPFTTRLVEPYKRYVFLNNILPEDQGPIVADYAVGKLKAQKIALIYYQLESGMNFGKSIIAHLDQKYKMKPVADEQIPFAAVDISANLLRVKAANPDVILAFLLGPIGGRHIRDLREMGITAKILGGTALNIVGTADAAGPAIDGVMFYEGIGDSPDQPTGAFKKYVDAFIAKYPDNRVITMGTVNWCVWNAMQALGEGLKRAGRDLTRENFIDALETIKDLDAGTSKLTYTPQLHYGPRVLNLYQWTKDGKRLKLEGPFEIKK